MAVTEQKLYVFAYVDTQWVPCGQLTLTEDGAELLASTFAYGLRYLESPDAWGRRVIESRAQTGVIL